jgi:hypothetical protein
MAERQKQLTEQMRIFEGLQTSGAEKTRNKVIPAHKELVKTYQDLRQTLDDVGIEHGQLVTAYEDMVPVVEELAATEDEHIQKQLEYQSTWDLYVADRLAGAKKTGEADRQQAQETEALLKATADAEMARRQKIADFVTATMKSMFEEIGRDIAAGELSWKSLGEAALKVLGKIVSAMGDQLAADAAVDLIRAFAALASIVGAWAAPGYFASAAIKAGGAAAAWIAGAALGAIKLAQGGDFTVPPGYPDDSYPMRVQSGEHVTVTPAGAGGDMFHIIINLDGRPLYDGVTRASRDRRVLISARSVVP